MSETHVSNNLPGTIGGALFATITGFNSVLLLIDIDQIMTAVIITGMSAFTGAVIGYFTNKYLKKFFGK